MSRTAQSTSPRGRVLIIDSDTDTVARLTEELKKEGYRVECAEHTNRCFEKIKNDQVDVLILAVEAWGNKGCQLIPIINMINRSVPIIVTSSDDSIEIAEQVREQGIFYYALKPLDMEEVKLALKNALSRKLTQRVGPFFPISKSVERSDFEEEILDLHAASSLLKMSKNAVARLAKAGEIPASRIGSKWLFIRNQLLEWLRVTAAGNQRNYGTLILETMDEGVAVVNRKLRIVSCNSAYLQSLDVPRDKIIGEYCFKVSHRSQVPCDESACPVRQAFNKKHPVKYMHVNYDSEGNEHFCDVIALPMKGKGDKVTHVLEVIRDNTEIYNLNKHLNWIMSFFAHESKKTLGPVVMNISALVDEALSENIPASQRKDMLLSSLCSLKLLHDMIRNYIFSYHAENRQLQCCRKLCDINEEILEPTFDEFKPILNKKSMTLVLRIEGVSKGYCDPHLMRIAVSNLINNAAKYGSDGTKIQCLLRAEGRNTELQIMNEGTGIPRDRLDDVFDRFARFDEVGISGTGLGLHVVKTIADMHHGTVKARSGYLVNGFPISYEEFSSRTDLHDIFEKSLRKFATFQLSIPGSEQDKRAEV